MSGLDSFEHKPGAADAPSRRPRRPIVLDIWARIRRHPWILCSTTIIGIVFAVVVVVLFPQYTAEAVLGIDTQKNDWTMMQSPVEDVPKDRGMILALAWSEAQRLQSWPIALRVADALHLELDPRFAPGHHGLRKIANDVRNWITGNPGATTTPPAFQGIDPQAIDPARMELAERLLAGLSVSSDHNNGQIQLRYTTNDPVLSAIIASKWVEIGVADQVEKKDSDLRRGTEWIERQLSELRDRVVQSDKAVQEYKVAFHLMPVARGETLAQQQAAELDQQLTVSMGELASLQGRIRYFDEAKRGDLDALSKSPDAMASRVLQDLRISYVQSRSTLQQLESTLGPRHPDVIRQRATLAGVEDSINKELNRIQGSLVSQSGMLQKKIDSIRADSGSALRKLDGQTLAESHFHELEANAATNRSVYNSFLLHSRELITQLNMQRPTNLVLSPPRVPISTRHSNGMVVGLAGILGLGLGAMLAVLLDSLEGGFRSAEELKQSGFRLAGILPEVRSGRKSNAIFAEMLLNVCAALEPLPGVTLVTSALSGEGKTTTSVNIAKTLGRSGKKVVLVDGDLVSPKVHEHFGIPNGRGLRDVLVGKATFPEIIVKNRGYGIDVMPAGASEDRTLLGSQSLADVLIALKEHYDHIVIDSAPVLIVADTLMIAKNVDHVVVPVRWRKTSKDTAFAALDILHKQGVPVTCVLTRVDIRKYARYDSREIKHYLKYWNAVQAPAQ